MLVELGTSEVKLEWYRLILRINIERQQVCFSIPEFSRTKLISVQLDEQVMP